MCPLGKPESFCRDGVIADVHALNHFDRISIAESAVAKYRHFDTGRESVEDLHQIALAGAQLHEAAMGDVVVDDEDTGDALLFDRALESVIGNLRRLKGA